MDITGFYDGLAEHYHLLFADWEAGGAWQAETLLPVLRETATGPVGTLLDVTCGIGTQAIPLARLGLRVHGTDLRPTAVERARAEAARAGIEATFAVADLRALGTAAGEGYDAVVALDNPLAHLLEPGDLERAVAAMAARARPGGAVVAGTRDYDELRRAGAGGETRVLGEAPARRAIVQVWDWAADGTRFRLDQIVLSEAGGWRVVTAGSARFRAYGRRELLAAFAAAGLRDVRWLEPHDTGYYQPLVAGRRAA